MNHFYRGRFYGANRAEEPEALALVDVKGNSLDGNEIAVSFLEIAGDDGCGHYGPYRGSIPEPWWHLSGAGLCEENILHELKKVQKHSWE
jgi:hypothetical protein